MVQNVSILESNIEQLKKGSQLLETNVQEIEDLKYKVKTLNKELETNNIKMNDEQNKHNQISTMHKAKIDELNKNLLEKQNEINAKTKNNMYQDKCIGLSQEIDLLEEKVSSMKIYLSEKDDSIESLNKEINLLKSEISGLSSNNVEKENNLLIQIQNLESRISEINKEHETYIHKIESRFNVEMENKTSLINSEHEHVINEIKVEKDH